MENVKSIIKPISVEVCIDKENPLNCDACWCDYFDHDEDEKSIRWCNLFLEHLKLDSTTGGRLRCVACLEGFGC